MKYTITQNNAQEFIDEITTKLLTNEKLVVSVESSKIGNWSMTRLWRAWIATTADFLAANGVTMPLMIKDSGKLYGSRRFNAADAHELFSAQWLGCDKDGKRLSWSKSGRDGMRPATKGERFDALRKHEEWSMFKGIKLFNPSNSEYMQIQKEQNC